MRKRSGSLFELLFAPIDAASAAAFRILFGLLMFVGTIRFLFSGWIERFYDQPEFLFKYSGFSWVQPWPLWGLYVHVAALALLALLVAVGLFYRASAILLFVGFTYLELLDVTNYLNHYYLVSLLALLCVFMPLDAAWSVDALRRPSLRRESIPAWVIALLRFQVGVVYLFAGIAKAGSDWLLHAQPLGIWLSARTDAPLVGPLLDERWVAYAASWAGFLFDTTIVLWLSWRRSRAVAFVALFGFHILTGLLFNIGMFPFIMTAAATVFASPSWPRRLSSRLRRHTVPPGPAPAPGRWRAMGIALAATYCAVQIALPVRHLLYPGDVLWNEEGMRWSWRVMVREKHGSVTFFVRLPGQRAELQVSPRKYLSSRQEREMAGQPDLILQLAHHIACDFGARGRGEVEVRAEALVSLNGRPAAPMIDPEVDLARVDDGLDRKRWILPAPPTSPLTAPAVRSVAARRRAPETARPAARPGWRFPPPR